MSRVYLSLGSNIEPQQHLIACLDALQERFGTLTLSPVYESAAMGFDGDNFLNLVVGLNTDVPVGELQKCLHQIEADNGRVRGKKSFASRTLDIDILTYDHLSGDVDGVYLPRAEILRYAFVLKPLVDLIADEVHPAYGKSYVQLWQEGDFSDQAMWPVYLDWHPA